MLIPRFELTQSDEEVFIVLHAPYANIKDTEVHVEGNDFRFYSSPYYLRLNLPGEIVENDASAGTYDCEKGAFSMRFSKVNKGEHFENLDMISSLLQPPKKKTNIPNIEVISNPAADSEIDKGEKEDEGQISESDEWFIPQNVTEKEPLISLEHPQYGFGNKISRALDAFEEPWLAEIIDLPQPDKTPVSLRKSLREKHETKSFNDTHYVAEYLEPEQINEYINFEAEWDKLKSEEIAFSEEDVDLLKELPNKEYLLNDKEIRSITLGLVDILFGSCYNYRTTLGENTVESGWTIAKLSSTLSWFQCFEEPKEVLIACLRRSLCFPLFRNWNLSMKVIEDVKEVLKLGKKYIIKRFCEIHSLFNKSCEPRYVLNQLYIKDYLVWMQQSPVSLFETLAKEFDEISVTKEEIGFNLIELEASAYDVYVKDYVIENTATESADLLKKFSKLTTTEKPILSVTSSSSDTDSDSDSTSNTSSCSSSDTNESKKSSKESDHTSDSRKSNYGSSSSKSLDSDDDSETNPE
ncbi:protein SHQ1 homolog [Belonocnema kinseyi]|uniref:protein SHQ1 homolog n=1 Tax=Belonocnema kinseyi TaxID=2817044 RepID=UPI00143DB81A|nr:protein SHQ1 homolog [Belonocnema kinseyi]XP_033213786.1 protein SHQ1 homolog [Belonocnema kinseyi]